MSKSNPSLRTIFLQALEIQEVEKRQACLKDLCAGDESLRREVEDLLRLEKEAQRFLPDRAENPARDQTGERIGRYKLLQKIGEGGCGIVYMAEQQEPVRRNVALKVIKLGMDTREVIARFEAERQALALMDHPHIARVLDAGATEAGRPYFVMELVRGYKITDYCDEHLIEIRERLELFIQVCQAVQHAHQKGIIHRDLKPSNILVTIIDGRAVPKVIDFGIAKATSGRLTDMTLFTALEQFIGTPAYMSPEQTAMTVVDIDTRSDVYSLGVLLYELLTGTTPFETKELLESGLDQMRRTIREKEPPRPSTRLTQTRASSARRAGTIQLPPGDLDWIVMKCLEKDRSRRYQTASDLAQDVRRQLSGEPITARPPSRVYLLSKAARRHKTALLTAGLLTGILIGGIGALGLGFRRAAVERDRATELGYATDIGLCWSRWFWSDYAQCRQLLKANIPKAGQRDLRSFEWWYLWRLCRADDAFALGQVPGNIWSFDFLPNNQIVAGAGQTRTTAAGDLSDTGNGLFIWDVGERRLVKKVLNERAVSSVSVSPDGARLAVASWMNGFDLLETTSFAKISRHSCDSPVTGVRYSPDGKWLAARADRNLYLYHADSDAQAEVLPAFEHNLEVPAFSRDSRFIAFSTPENRIGIWDLRRHEFAQKLTNAAELNLDGPLGSGLYGFAVSHAFSPDGTLLAEGDFFGRVYIHDLRTGGARLLWEHFGAFARVAFSPDGKTLASGAWDGVVKLWQTETGLELGTWQGHGAHIGSLGFAPDGRTIVSSGGDGYLRFWQTNSLLAPVDSFGFRKRLIAASSPTNAVYLGIPSNWHVSSNGRLLYDAFDGRPNTPSRRDEVGYARSDEQVLAPGGRFLAGRWKDGLCQVRDLEARRDGPGYHPMPGEELRAVSPDGRFVLSSVPGGPAFIREADTGAASVLPTAQNAPLRTAEFSGRGSFLGTLTTAGGIEVRYRKNLRLLAAGQLPNAEGGAYASALTFTYDEKTLACGTSSDTRVLVIHLDSARQRFTEAPFNGFTLCALAFSPDGKTLAAGGFSDEVMLYDVSSGKLRAKVSASHEGAIQAMAFTPDGLRLALGDDQNIGLWDLRSKRLLLSISPAGDQPLQQLLFNSKGDWMLATAGKHGRYCKIYYGPREE